MNVFDRINEWLDRTEVSWVNLLTKALPILVPIIPAMQTKRHVVEVLGYSQEASWIAAIIVEFFGYAAMYKMIQFAEHNRRYAEKNRAPFGVAVMIYLAYLAIIIVFNVIPEVVTKQPVHVIWMNALFAVLSVPAGALTAVSALHTERKEAMKRKPTNSLPNEHRTEDERPLPERRTNTERTPNSGRTNVPQPANEHRTPNEQPMGFPTERTQSERLFEYVSELEANGEQVPGPSELARRLGMSKSYISEQLSKWRNG